MLSTTLTFKRQPPLYEHAGEELKSLKQSAAQRQQGQKAARAEADARAAGAVEAAKGKAKSLERRLRKMEAEYRAALDAKAAELAHRLLTATQCTPLTNQTPLSEAELAHRLKPDLLHRSLTR